MPPMNVATPSIGCPFLLGEEVRISPGGRVFLMLDINGDEATIGWIKEGVPDEWTLPWNTLLPVTCDGEDLAD